MSMLQCIECKTMLSEYAEKCTGCGCPVDKIKSIIENNKSELVNEKTNTSLCLAENTEALRIAHNQKCQEKILELKNTLSEKITEHKKEFNQNNNLIHKNKKNELEKELNEVQITLKYLIEKRLNGNFSKKDLNVINQDIDNAKTQENSLIERINDLNNSLTENKQLEAEILSLTAEYDLLIKEEQSKISSTEEFEKKYITELTSPKNIENEILRIIDKLGVINADNLSNYSFALEKAENNVIFDSIKNLIKTNKIQKNSENNELYIPSEKKVLNKEKKENSTTNSKEVPRDDLNQYHPPFSKKKTEEKTIIQCKSNTKLWGPLCSFLTFGLCGLILSLLNLEELGIIFLFFGGIFLLLFLWVLFFSYKKEITVTNKRVYGKTAFWNYVEIPLSSVSAIRRSSFGGLRVSSSSGWIEFGYVTNAQEIYKEISKLLIEREDKFFIQ